MVINQQECLANISVCLIICSVFVIYIYININIYIFIYLTAVNIRLVYKSSSYLKFLC